MANETDQSEERDLHLLAQVILHEVELEMRYDEVRALQAELDPLVRARCTKAECRAYLRLEGKAAN